MKTLSETQKTATTPRSMWRAVLFSSLALVLAFCVQPQLHAQGITGSITGTVTDLTGATVAGATVTVTQTATNTVHTATTSEIGNFKIPQLPRSCRLMPNWSSVPRMKP